MARAKERETILDDGACIHGAGVLLKHVQALEGEISGVLAEAKDIEFIHRARVASRRLRAAMPLFLACLPKKKSPAWQKQIRSVTRALGAARDADVQIERVKKILKKTPEKALRPGILRLILRLEQQRAGLQPAVLTAGQELKESGVLEQMGRHFTALAAQSGSVYMYTPRLYQHSSQSINARLADLLAFEPYVTQPEKVTELHEMRIQAKWLRYTMESFASLYSNELQPYLKVIRNAQELLGDIHDCDVWTEFLPRFLEEERMRVLDYYGHTRFFNRLAPGIQFFQQDLAANRSSLYSEFVDSWQKWRADNTWERLQETLQIPFPDPGEIFPPKPAGKPDPYEV